MRNLNYVIAIFPMLCLASCSATPQQDNSSAELVSGPEAKSLERPATATNIGDISSTSLPDSNYKDEAWLAARKRGMAEMSAEDADSSKRGTIEPMALDPYTMSDYPDVVKRWRRILPAVERERRLSAKLAAANPKCDGVVNAQITDHGSANNRHYMTECNNLTRVYFDTASLRKKVPAVIRTQADMGAAGMMDWWRMGFLLLLIMFVAASSQSGAQAVNGCISLIFAMILLIVASAMTWLGAAAVPAWLAADNEGRDVALRQCQMEMTVAVLPFLLAARFGVPRDAAKVVMPLSWTVDTSEATSARHPLLAFG